MRENKQYTILVIDDAKDMQLLLDFDLTSAGYSVLCCDNGHDGLNLLATKDVDLILLDMYMPGLSGLQTLEQITAQPEHVNVSVIMLSSSDDEDEIVAALELGAADYVVKPYVSKILLARIKTAIRLKEKTEQLEYLAKTDFLTGLHNRGSFFDLSTKAINLAHRAGQSLVVVMIDIDHFKKVNDNFGHDLGDKVLVSFAQCMTEHFRSYDILGRIGGEEFAVCLPNISIDNAMLVCERLRSEVENIEIPLTPANTEQVKITISIGVTQAVDKILTVDALLKQADSALYFAKENGRNRVIDTTTMINKNIADEPSIAHKKIEISPINTPNELENTMNNIDGIDKSIGINNVLGDEALFEEILVMFYQDHYEDAKKLDLAISSHDTASCKHIAHTLKGVSCSVGAMALFEKVKAIDLAVSENQQTELHRLYADFLPEFDRVMNAISQSLTVE